MSLPFGYYLSRNSLSPALLVSTRKALHMKIKTSFAPALLALALLATGANTQAQQKDSDKKTPNAKPAAASTTPAPAATPATAPATNATTMPATSSTASAVNATTAPLELARSAYKALGGDKFRDLKSLVITGSVDLYSPNSVQALTGKFAIVTSKGRVRTEIQSPVFSLRQIYDGQTNYSSMRQMELPPPTKFGPYLLTHFEQTGYLVTALPDKKKQRAFRITDPEGNVTDFFIDPATSRIVTYTIPYNGLTFSVENTSQKEVEGVLIPYAFTWRLDTPQGTFHAEYNVKDVKLNQELGPDMFEIPAQ